MTSTAPDGNVAQIPISFADPVRRSSFGYSESLGIWSCRFSADGNEVVAGGSGKIFGLLKLLFCKVPSLTGHDSIRSFG